MCYPARTASSHASSAPFNFTVSTPPSTTSPGFFWVNLAAYQADECLIPFAPIPFSKRQEDTKKLAIACYRRNQLAFATGFISNDELDIDGDNLEDSDYDDLRQRILSFNATNRGIGHTTPEKIIPGLKRLRSKLDIMTVGSSLIVYLPSRVGLLGIAAVTEEVHEGTEIENQGFPGFTTLLGIKWIVGPLCAGDVKWCGIQIPEVQQFTHNLGLRISGPVQAMNFAQYSTIFKMFV